MSPRQQNIGKPITDMHSTGTIEVFLRDHVEARFRIQCLKDVVLFKCDNTNLIIMVGDWADDHRFLADWKKATLHRGDSRHNCGVHVQHTAHIRTRLMNRRM